MATVKELSVQVAELRAAMEVMFGVIQSQGALIATLEDKLGDIRVDVNDLDEAVMELRHDSSEKSQCVRFEQQLETVLAVRQVGVQAVQSVAQERVVANQWVATQDEVDAQIAWTAWTSLPQVDRAQIIKSLKLTGKSVSRANVVQIQTAWNEYIDAQNQALDDEHEVPVDVDASSVEEIAAYEADCQYSLIADGGDNEPF